MTLYPLDTKLIYKKKGYGFMLNVVMMMGRLTADPEVRVSQNNNEFVTFSLAVQRPKPKDAEAQTDFFNCAAWNGTAKIISSYFGKGDLIVIQGTLRKRSWVDNEGRTRYSEQIIVKNVYFTGNQRKSEDTLPPTPPELNDFNILTQNDMSDYEEILTDDGVPF